MATNINFQKQQAEAAVPKKRKTSAKGLLFAFIFLLIIVAIFAGVKFYAKSLEKEDESLVEQITQAKDAINQEDLSRVIDFNERLSIIDQTLAQQSTTTGAILGDVATVVVPRVVLNTFQHERDVATGNDTVSFSADADNFDLIAQQLVALKDSPKFSDVTISDTGLDDAGRVTFKISAQYEGSAVGVPAQPKSTNEPVELEPVTVTEPVAEDAAITPEEGGEAQELQQDESQKVQQDEPQEVQQDESQDTADNEPNDVAEADPAAVGAQL